MRLPRSHSRQLDKAIPASKIAALSLGEFVGLVADNPEKEKLKMFHSEIINEHDKLNHKVNFYEQLPIVKNITLQQVSNNFYQVKMDIKRLIQKEIKRLKREQATLS